MGNEFCKGCQDNCLSGLLEQDFSKKYARRKYNLHKFRIYER